MSLPFPTSLLLQTHNLNISGSGVSPKFRLSPEAYVFHPRGASAQGQLRSIVEGQHPNLQFPPISRVHTPLHPDNPMPPSLSSVAPHTMSAGGATPWHSPASSTMSGTNGRHNDQAPRSHPASSGMNGSIYANHGGEDARTNYVSQYERSTNNRPCTASTLGLGGRNNASPRPYATVSSSPYFS